MFEINESRSSATCLGIKVSGKVSTADYRILRERLQAMIATHGQANLVVLIEDFEGWDDADAVREDVALGFDEYPQIDRAAFVVDNRWYAAAVKLLDPLTRLTEEKAFSPQEIDDAWDWACAG